MNLEKRIQVLSLLGQNLKNLESDFWQEKIARSGYENGWFTKESVTFALESIRDQMLDESKLRAWTSNYKILDKTSAPKRVGLILAGNIPLVGFQDVLTVFASGNIALIKKSDKDSVLLDALMAIMVETDSEVADLLLSGGKMESYDAVIATGSNNSSRYFEAYFGHVPHIIRKNRNSVGILYPETSLETIERIGKDIFTYFGLGCRNVSKLMVPLGFDLTKIMEALHAYNSVNLHHKYKNNFDFNIAVNMLNKQHYLNNGSVMLMEKQVLASSIATLHFEYYDGLEDLRQKIEVYREEIQCIVSEKPLEFLSTVAPGQSQMPSLFDYADDVDTMEFLINLG